MNIMHEINISENETIFLISSSKESWGNCVSIWFFAAHLYFMCLGAKLHEGVTVIDKWYDDISSVMLVSREQSNNISPLSSITYSYIKTQTCWYINNSAMDV